MRNYSIDTLRTVAILAVILLHSDRLLPAATDGVLFTYFRTTWRFAVPFFFAASAFLYSQKINNTYDAYSLTVRYVKRLFFLYFSWSLIYLIKLPDMVNYVFLAQSPKEYYWKVAALLTQVAAGLPQDVLKIMFLDGMYHLWFIPALAFGLLLLSLAHASGTTKWLLLGSGALYLLSLVSKFPHGNLVIAVFCCALGWLLVKLQPQSAINSIYIILAGLVVTYLEMHYLHGGLTVFQVTYGIGPIMSAIGLLMLALAIPEFSKGSFLSKTGIYTLGVYLSHPLFDQFFSAHPNWWGGAVGLIGFPLAVFVGSLGMTLLLSRNVFTKALVA